MTRYTITHTDDRGQVWFIHALAPLTTPSWTDRFDDAKTWASKASASSNLRRYRLDEIGARPVKHELTPVRIVESGSKRERVQANVERIAQRDMVARLHGEETAEFIATKYPTALPLLADGWTIDGALNHVQGMCDRDVCCGWEDGEYGVDVPRGAHKAQQPEVAEQPERRRTILVAVEVDTRSSDDDLMAAMRARLSEFYPADDETVVPASFRAAVTSAEVMRHIDGALFVGLGNEDEIGDEAMSVSSAIFHKAAQA